MIGGYPAQVVRAIQSARSEIFLFTEFSSDKDDVRRFLRLRRTARRHFGPLCMRGLALAISFAVVTAIPSGCGSVRAKRMPLTHAFIDALHRAGEVHGCGILGRCNQGWPDSDEQEARFQ